MLTDTPILTVSDRGVDFRPAGRLRAGDRVIGHDGAPHRLRVVRPIPLHTRLVSLSVAGRTPVRLPGSALVLCPHALPPPTSGVAVPGELRARARALRTDMPQAERRLWQRLRNLQLQVKFRRQHPVGPYVADFYCREARLVVEVDGDTHYRTDEARAHDRARDAYMDSLGVRVLRYGNEEVRANLDGVVQAVWLACREHALRDDATRGWVLAKKLTAGDEVFVCEGDMEATAPHPGPPRGRGGGTATATATAAACLFGLRAVMVRDLGRSSADAFELLVEDAHSLVTPSCVVHDGLIL